MSDDPLIALACDVTSEPEPDYGNWITVRMSPPMGLAIATVLEGYLDGDNNVTIGIGMALTSYLMKTMDSDAMREYVDADEQIRQVCATKLARLGLRPLCGGN